MKSETRINKMLLYIAISMYLFLLIWVISLKCNANWVLEDSAYMRALPLYDRVGKNIIPFHDMIENGIYFNLDYFMNVIIYLPFGIYLSIFINNKHKYWKSLIIIVISTLLFELVQLFTGIGGLDGSDIVCNVSGGVLGMLIYYLISKIKNYNKIINIINLVVIIIFAPLAIYAFINTLLNLHLYKI